MFQVRWFNDVHFCVENQIKNVKKKVVGVQDGVCCDKHVTSRVRDPSAASSDRLNRALLPAYAITGFFKAHETPVAEWVTLATRNSVRAETLNEMTHRTLRHQHTTPTRTA